MHAVSTHQWHHCWGRGVSWKQTTFVDEILACFTLLGGVCIKERALSTDSSLSTYNDAGNWMDDSIYIVFILREATRLVDSTSASNVDILAVRTSNQENLGRYICAYKCHKSRPIIYSLTCVRPNWTRLQPLRVAWEHFHETPAREPKKKKISPGVHPLIHHLQPIQPPVPVQK